MRRDTVHTQPQKLHTSLLQFGIDFSKGYELGGAHRGEIRRVGKEDQPASLKILQLKHPMGSHCFEGWCGLTYPGHAYNLLSYFFHFIPPFSLYLVFSFSLGHLLDLHITDPSFLIL
jgi:hypothetical protein